MIPWRQSGARSAILLAAMLAAASPAWALLPGDTPGISSAPWGAWKSDLADASFIRYHKPTSLALDSEGRPHIVYTSAASSSDATATAWYAWFDDFTWKRIPLGYKSSGHGIAIGPEGTVHVLFEYRDTEPAELRHGIVTVSGLQIETLATGNALRAAEIAIDSAGTLHTYYSYSGQEILPLILEYGRNKGSGWTYEIVDTSTFAMDDSSGFAITSDGRVHIAFADHGNSWSQENIGHAVRDSAGTWTVQRLSQACFDFVDISLDAAGSAHVACRSLKDGLVYLHDDGSAWSREILFDGLTFRTPEDRGWEPAIAVDSKGRPHISYRDSLHLSNPNHPFAHMNMKYATKTVDGWVYETVDRGGAGTGLSSDIVIDANDRPRLSYVMAYLVAGYGSDGPYPHSWNLMYAEPATASLRAVGE